jgi:hypothetical protein
MKCPHCSKHIDDALLKKAVASINGKKSSRTLTPEQAAAMTAARERKRKDDKQ